VAEVAEDLKAVFGKKREKTARALAEKFISLYNKSYPKAVSIFEAGVEHALTNLFATQEATTPGYARRTCWSASSSP
jgi:hypothetical protein